ncbi:MAG: orotidine-5'-phosphate decarboxylase [Bdellovibrionales bacterium]|nr:orotidine-5'-phosphate decarboxylase [Bdellovibrionales bacterium]
MMKANDRFILALDDQSQWAECEKLLDLIGSSLSFVKVGSIAFSAMGPAVLSKIHQRGLKIFLDLKYHDIPNTVSKAVDRVTDHVPLELFTVHAAGGAEMIESTQNVLQKKFSSNRPKMIAITVLTSLHVDFFWKLGFPLEMQTVDLVSSLAKNAVDAGADGVVCSGLELESLHGVLSPGVLKIVPGVRIESLGDDQKRVVTPKQAFDMGASALVLGRTVTQSVDPKATFESLLSL